MLDTLLLCRALARLTMNEREAFLDHHICGRTHDAIADTMGLTRQGVRYLIRAAGAKLAADTRLQAAYAAEERAP